MFMVKKLTLFFTGNSAEKPLLPIYTPSKEGNDNISNEQNNTFDPLLKVNQTVKSYLDLTVSTLKEYKEKYNNTFNNTFFFEQSRVHADKELIKQAFDLVDALYPNLSNIDHLNNHYVHTTFLIRLEKNGVNVETRKELIELIDRLNAARETKINVINELTTGPSFNQMVA